MVFIDNFSVEWNNPCMNLCLHIMYIYCHCYALYNLEIILLDIVTYKLYWTTNVHSISFFNTLWIGIVQSWVTIINNKQIIQKTWIKQININSRFLWYHKVLESKMDMPIETGVLGFFPTLKFDYQTHITCSFFV